MDRSLSILGITSAVVMLVVTVCFRVAKGSRDASLFGRATLWSQLTLFVAFALLYRLSVGNTELAWLLLCAVLIGLVATVAIWIRTALKRKHADSSELR
jgi:hypothetical protein